MDGVVDDGDPFEEGLADEAVIAAGVGGRHAPLVPPEQVDPTPRDPVVTSGEDLVEASRCGAAGEAQGESSACPDGLDGLADHLVGRGTARGLGVREDAQLPGRHSTRQATSSSGATSRSASAGPQLPAGYGRGSGLRARSGS